MNEAVSIPVEGWMFSADLFHDVCSVADES